MDIPDHIYFVLRYFDGFEGARTDMSVLLVNAIADRLPLQSGSVHLCVTSPPYYFVRTYEGAEGQIGKEALHDCLGWATGNSCGECYVCHTRAWAREVWRVLRDDGTFWLDIGDSFNESGGAGGDYNAGGLREGQSKYGRKSVKTLKERDMLGIPWRVALALQADGWYLRSEIIWRKPNPMPFPLFGWRWERHRLKVKSEAKREYERLIAEEMQRTGCRRDYAAKNVIAERPELMQECPGCVKCNPNDGYVLRKSAWRPTSAHEQIFLFSKTAKYYCDDIAVQEPIVWTKGGNQTIGKKGDSPTYSGNEYDKDRTGKNMRDVVEFKQSNYNGGHFAVFPAGLPELAIKAGTSEAGVCSVCGSPYARVIEAPDWRTWRATCGHDAPTAPATVLDLFAGSGTTGIAARALGRHAILLDLSMQYLLQDARARLSIDALDEWEHGKDGNESDLSGLPMFEPLFPLR